MSYGKDYNFKYTKLEYIFKREGKYDVKYLFRKVFNPNCPKRFPCKELMRGLESKEAAKEGKYHYLVC